MKYVKIFVAAILGATITVSSGRAFEPEQPGEQPRNLPTLLLEVVDESTRAPLSGATVWVRATRGRTHTGEGKTDEEGRYLVTAPGAATLGFDIFVAAPGFATSGLVSAAGGTPHFALLMQRSEMIGGVVHDEAGRPISGARVLATNYPLMLCWQEILASQNSSLTITTTDQNGRWQSESLPAAAGADSQVKVVVIHPDYVSREFRTTAKEARAASSVQVLKAGLSISGTVLSPFDRPVRGATITILVPRSDGLYAQLTTDENGRFHTGRFLDPARMGFELIVGMNGLATTFHYVESRAVSEPQVIKLTRRRPFAGRVVDAHGHPISGAIVACRRDVSYGPLGWEAETGADGRFVWLDAPTSGALFLRAFKPGFRAAGRSATRPGSSEVTITLVEH